MKHLDEQEIARMIEGGISKKERKRYMEHLAECETCFAVYSETLRYVEEQEKEAGVSTFPALGAVARRFFENVVDAVQSRPLRLAAVSVTMILLVVLVGVTVQNRGNVTQAQLERIEERISGYDSGVYAFSPSKSKKAAVVKAGLLVEMLAIVKDADGDDELSAVLISMLKEEMKILLDGNTDNIVMEPESLSRLIRRQVDKQGFEELFEFGRFVERGILAALEGETPNPGDIDKHISTAGKPGNELPPGVVKALATLKKASDIEEFKKIFITVEEVLLIME